MVSDSFYFCVIKFLGNILIVGLLLFQSAGMGLIYSLQLGAARHEVKQRIKHGVPEEDRVLLKIPLSLEQTENDLFHRVHAGEFRYKGEMYDILKSERHGDTTWYTCIHDVKESGIFKNLDEKVKLFVSNSPDQQKQRSSAFSFFHQQFVMPFSSADTLVDELKQANYMDFNDRELKGFLIKPWRPPILATLPID